MGERRLYLAFMQNLRLTLPALGLSFFLLNTSAHAAAPRCADIFAVDASRKTMAELLDIRTFAKGGTSSRELRPQVIEVVTPAAHFSLGLGPSPRGLVLNVYMKTGGDRSLFNWTLSAAERVFSKYLVSDQAVSQSYIGMSMLLSAQKAPEVEAGFMKLKRALNSRALKPIDAIPASLKNKTHSERVEFIKTLLSTAIAEQGITNNALFFNRNLSTIHKLFLENLTSVELSVFHYSMFDRMITYEAQIQIAKRIEEINKTQELTQQERFTEEAVIEGIRQKFFEIADTVSASHSKYMEKLSEAQQVLRSYREYRFEERGAEVRGQLAKLESEIKELRKQMVLTYSRPTAYFYVSSRPSEIYVSKDPVIEARHNDLESKIGNKKGQLERLERARADEVLKFNERERSAYATLQLETQQANGSNFNPYSGGADYGIMNMNSTVRHHYLNTSIPKNRISEVAAIGTPIGNSRQLMKSIFDTPNFGSNADSTIPIRQTEMKPSMVETLEGYGIRSVFELTQYSAREYVEKFGMSLPEFKSLLTELNVLGIHVHFDAKWDRENHRILKQHPEFHQYRHTPKESNNLRWEDPYKSDRRDPMDSN